MIVTKFHGHKIPVCVSRNSGVCVTKFHGHRFRCVCHEIPVCVSRNSMVTKFRCVCHEIEPRLNGADNMHARARAFWCASRRTIQTGRTVCVCMLFISFCTVSVQFLSSFCHTFRPDIKREVPASGLVCLPCLLLPPAWRSPIVRLCRLCRAPLSAFN